MREAGSWLYYFYMKPTQSLGNNLWLRNRSLKRWRQIRQEPPSCLKSSLQPLSSPRLEIWRLFKLFPNNAIEDEATVLKRGVTGSCMKFPRPFILFWVGADFPLWCSDAKTERGFCILLMTVWATSLLGELWHISEVTEKGKNLDQFSSWWHVLSFPYRPLPQWCDICRQMGNTLQLMVLTSLASWTINEEPHPPPLFPA